jgi:hypothetical protein
MISNALYVTLGILALLSLLFRLVVHFLPKETRKKLVLFKNPRNAIWQARAVWAFLASMFKREWTIDDYPIRLSFTSTTEPLRKSRLKPLPWTASVINWSGMAGSANSRQEALAELRRNFDRFKATKPNLPRPGSKVPVGFAASVRVDRHSELEKDFVKRVLDLDWAWISDESTLWDFHEDETNESLTEKIRLTYGVDVSDISTGNLADIFDRISKIKTVPPTPD